MANTKSKLARTLAEAVETANRAARLLEQKDAEIARLRMELELTKFCLSLPEWMRNVKPATETIQ